VVVAVNPLNRMIAQPAKVWVEASEERLAGNFRAVAEAAGAETELLAVVKANAYGHGLELCSVALARAGARWLGVTCVSEGARVRTGLAETGFAASEGVEILVMCGLLPEDATLFAEHRLTPVVWTAEQVAWLRAAAPPRTRVHIEIDTGMGRQGVRPGRELDKLLAELQGAEMIIDGIMTHFCESEVAHSELTRTQQRRFEGAVAQLREKGLRPAWVHAGNSSSLDNVDNLVGDVGSEWLVELAKSVGARAMVRSGLALYGYCLPIEGAGPSVAQVRPALKPVMQWKTRVLAVRELAVEETVGYGATFTASAPMRVALLPVGYADGLRRELSSRTGERGSQQGGWVMVRGARAPIIGRVSMNLTVVDVTGIEGVAAGDEVVLLGDGVTAEDHARLAGTIPYEILCGVRER
jgi:alanine racemase